ncbi:GrpB family protein [Gracilibacillus sp. S3-1-1]|uniref:GrpB family protein n=1 Tax=Gracilibacillus pellucidus TaxID=3095368 RepID=A0ACC6M8C8_9BACI|nr:GrpB family protein [Gracilibacillus sp. S3-1-1]MDX8047180.1 GrpB family protein [Gracilibacillus sp. S3-1-1]
MRKVEVCPSNENWPSMFEAEAKKLQSIFGQEMIAIHHIGSTSVPGLQAKPVIDMMPVVKNIDDVDAFNQEMNKLGYECKGENGISGRKYFQKGGDDRTHHVHIFQHGSDEINRHLAFRDYLRSHPEDRERYGTLKERLAQQFPDDMISYMEGKDGLVKEIEAKALKIWDEQKGR